MRIQKLARGILAISIMMALGSGCGVSPGTTLQDLLTSTGLGNVTVADVLNAIQNFTGQSTALPFGQPLSSNQQAQASEIRSQLQSGQISNQQYDDQMMQITGMQGPGRPFQASLGRSFGPEGFHGGPQGPMQGGPPHFNADALELTDEQQTQAQTIFDAMRQDITTLHQNAKAQIDAVLTADQLAILQSLDEGGPHGFRCFGPGHHDDELADPLGLTDDQKAQIKTIMDDTRTAVDARRQQARDEFRAILTTEQQAQLDEFEANHPHPPMPPPPTNP